VVFGPYSPTIPQNREPSKAQAIADAKLMTNNAPPIIKKNTVTKIAK
jgi:hypothetical protein